jgi:tetratricopeptide (TPR) repeat protein
MEMNVSKSQVREELGKRWKDQAVQLALLGRWDEAAQMNLRILELFPDDLTARNRLGKAYLELGRLEEAVAAYEESLQRQPSNPIARRNLAALYGALKRDPEQLAGISVSEDFEDDNEIEDVDDDDEALEEDESD